MDKNSIVIVFLVLQFIVTLTSAAYHEVNDLGAVAANIFGGIKTPVKLNVVQMPEPDHEHRHAEDEIGNDFSDDDMNEEDTDGEEDTDEDQLVEPSWIDLAYVLNDKDIDLDDDTDLLDMDLEKDPSIYQGHVPDQEHNDIHHPHLSRDEEINDEIKMDHMASKNGQMNMDPKTKPMGNMGVTAGKPSIVLMSEPDQEQSDDEDETGNDFVDVGINEGSTDGEENADADKSWIDFDDGEFDEHIDLDGDIDLLGPLLDMDLEKHPNIYQGQGADLEHNEDINKPKFPHLSIDDEDIKDEIKMDNMAPKKKQMNMVTKMKLINMFLTLQKMIHDQESSQYLSTFCQGYNEHAKSYQMHTHQYPKKYQHPMSQKMHAQQSSQYPTYGTTYAPKESNYPSYETTSSNTPQEKHEYSTYKTSSTNAPKANKYSNYEITSNYASQPYDSYEGSTHAPQSYGSYDKSTHDQGYKKYETSNEGHKNRYPKKYQHSTQQKKHAQQSREYSTYGTAYFPQANEYPIYKKTTYDPQANDYSSYETTSTHAPQANQYSYETTSRHAPQAYDSYDTYTYAPQAYGSHDTSTHDQEYSRNHASNQGHKNRHY